jgi:hypothetical protein
MSDIGQLMLAELRRIREALEGVQPLGFGKKVGPTYVFVRHHSVGTETYLWYTRDKNEGQNVPIRERDLTGYLVGVWRFDRGDDTTGEAVPKLNIQIRADRDYVVQTGFTTNFARTFLAGLLGLEPEALKEPVTLIVEDNVGSKARATVFCRVESRGIRLTPTLSRETKPEVLYDEVIERFGFSDPYAASEDRGA